jgi:hypothetical protein
MDQANGRRSVLSWPSPPGPAEPALSSHWYGPAFRLLSEADCEFLSRNGLNVRKFRRQRATLFLRYVRQMEKRAFELQARKLATEPVWDVTRGKLQLVGLGLRLRFVAAGFVLELPGSSRAANRALHQLAAFLRPPNLIEIPTTA